MTDQTTEQNNPAVPRRVLFCFSYDIDSQEGQFAGNVDPVLALNILQGMVLNFVARQAQQNGGKPDEATPVSQEPEAGPGGCGS